MRMVAFMGWQSVRDYCTVPGRLGSGCTSTLRPHGRKKVCDGVCDGRQRLGGLPHFYCGLYSPDKAAARPYLGVTMTMGWEVQPSDNGAGVIVIAALHINYGCAVLFPIEQNKAVTRHARILGCRETAVRS